MINGIATPVDLKLRLIPILKHMHHEVDMVSKVNKTFFMLNSTEHEIYPAHKCLNAQQLFSFYILLFPQLYLNLIDSGDPSKIHSWMLGR